MVRQLQPWYENLGKRQVKAPKIYFRDTGLLHALLGIRPRLELARDTQLGRLVGRFRVGAGAEAGCTPTMPTSGPRIRAPNSIC